MLASHVGIILASCLHSVCIVLALFCHHLGIILGSPWHHFGIVFGPILDPAGSFLRINGFLIHEAHCRRSYLGSSCHQTSRAAPTCSRTAMAPMKKAMKAMKAMKSMRASNVMTTSAAYGSVAETCGLKTKDVKAVMEGIVAVAAEQLKKNGKFKIRSFGLAVSFKFC